MYTLFLADSYATHQLHAVTVKSFASLNDADNARVYAQKAQANDDESFYFVERTA